MALRGPVTIIPASAIRENRHLFVDGDNEHSQDFPVNAAYYLTPQAPVTPNPNLRYTYVVPQTRTSTTYRRSKTAPARAYQARQTATPANVYRARARSSDYHFNLRDYARFSGPVKYPMPMYRKRKLRRVHPTTGSFAESRFQDAPTSVGTNVQAYSYYPYGSSLDQRFGQTNQGQAHPTAYSIWYPPATYATYPTSTAFQQQATFRRGQREDKYPVYWRFIVKLAQLIVAGALLGAVIGPSQGVSFAAFSKATRSEGQLVVVTVVALCAIATFLLIISVFLARSSQTWRNVDAILLSIMTFAYLCISCVETWYAFCYPPYGERFPQTCRIVQWAIAAILSFINLFLYGMDLLLAAKVGVSML